MTDDRWRERRDADDFSEFGSLFDDAEPTQDLDEIAPARRPAADTEEGISFGASDTGSLPHWTEPPTGEVPRFDARRAEPDHEEHHDVDVWSSFSSESPVWKDDEQIEPAIDPRPSGSMGATSGQHRRVSAPEHQVTEQHARVSGQQRRVAEAGADSPAREPSRITIGTDPSGMPRREPVGGARRRPGAAPSAARTRPGQAAPPSGRDMPAAIAVGLVLAAAFIAALMWRPWAAAALVTVLLGLAGVEFYDKVSEKGYRPAVVPGVAGCIAIPLSAYWLGEFAMPLAIAFGFMAVAASFIGARSIEAGPMPNVSITMLGMVWIGVLGSFAMLILRLSTANGSDLPTTDTWGTDTLFLLALGVVANDVGALFVGSAAGRTPLRAWISPNKTVEGLIGGSLMTIIVLVVVGIGTWSTTWTSYQDLLLLAIVISVLAPMGDLVESMFKRNLDTKDFGSIIKGHGGVLDRFDGFLFALPGVYYLTLVLQPWAS